MSSRIGPCMGLKPVQRLGSPTLLPQSWRKMRSPYEYKYDCGYYTLQVWHCTDTRSGRASAAPWSLFFEMILRAASRHIKASGKHYKLHIKPPSAYTHLDACLMTLTELMHAFRALHQDLVKTGDEVTVRLFLWDRGVHLGEQHEASNAMHVGCRGFDIAGNQTDVIATGRNVEITKANSSIAVLLQGPTDVQ
ncbi:hypothetical protein M440DRAFT_1390214 [Trichoderma longibrachiatum ATCC 18648]|uniref:Uncharacterized protein n=1 Tax=Trichoderma longibrachiatum ATCC 18648 TaxID=983965 RepID=A0A2T4CAH1_TRILO|nr:hypothetical protein M440DRAFT_1390214 [Trichoderma longibrachiatum ATCC 18648]